MVIQTPSSPWKATILTLFPEMFPGPLGYSLPQKALEKGHWALEAINIRDFATDKHKTVDDTPFGGGAGMVMRPDVLEAALLKARSLETGSGRPVYYLSPRGQTLTQAKARELAQGPGAIFVCGRYEGVDQRFLDLYNVEELSIGDYILFGGEVAAYVVLEACIRLLPGVIGTEASLEEESFESGLLEYPHFTRPRVWNDLTVPEVLVSGNHENIRLWRHQQAEQLTQLRRSDLWHLYKERQKK